MEKKKEYQQIEKIVSLITDILIPLLLEISLIIKKIKKGKIDPKKVKIEEWIEKLKNLPNLPE